MIIESTMFILDDGTLEWKNQKGRMHRLDGPAVIHPNGKREWYQHGLHHRKEGPAIIWPDGHQVWCQNKSINHEDGPAVIRRNGSVAYWIRGRKVEPFEGNYDG